MSLHTRSDKGRVKSPERRIEQVRNRSERRIKGWRDDLAVRIQGEQARRRRRIEAIRARLDATDISDAIVDFVAGEEGFVNHAYKPVSAEQYYTIGYGHYGPDVHPGDTITAAAARSLLKHDLSEFSAGVKKLLQRAATQQQFDALVSFAYNVGLGALASSTLLRKFNVGDIQGAAAEFGKWVNGASGPLQGLVNRRAAEKRIFLTGQYR